MLPSSLVIGGVELVDEIEGEEGFSMPEAMPLESALALWTLTGTQPADFMGTAQFTVPLVSGDLADADAVGAWLSERVRLFAANDTFLIAEEGKRTLTGRIRYAYATAHENNGRWGMLTISGTRYGAWEGTRIPLVDADGEPFIERPVSFPGVAHVRNTPGEMPGRLTTKLTADLGTDAFGIGIAPVSIPQTFGEEWDTLDTDIWADGMAWGHSDADTRYKPEQRTITSGGVGEPERYLTLKGEKLTVPESGMHYKSGMVRSLATFGPGQHITFRARPRHGDGWLSAVWFANDASSEEIDIEWPVGNGNLDTQVNFAVHNHPVGGEGSPGEESFMHTHSHSLADDFHDYAADWQSDAIRFYFEGKLKWTYTGPLVLATSLSLYATLKGGDAWTGAVNDSQLPAFLDVGPIRVYPYCYDPSADFGADDDAAARGDHANSLALDGDYAAVGAIPLTDANRYRGKYLPLARVKGVPGALLRTDSVVTGSGIAVTGHGWGQPVKLTAPSGAYSLEAAPVLEVPGVPVPSIETGSGYGDTVTLAENTTGASTHAVGPSATVAEAKQGVVLPAGVYDSIAFKCSGTGSATARLVDATDTTVLAYSDVIAVATGEVTFPLLVPVTLEAGAYIISYEPIADGTSLYYNASSNVYPQGCSNVVSGGSVVGNSAFMDDDLWFRVTGRLPLGFTSEVAVEMTGTGTGWLDTAQLLPGAFCETVRGTFAAGQGVLIDNAPADPGDRHVYITAAGAGIAGPSTGFLPQTHGSAGLAIPAGDSEVCLAANTDGDGLLSMWVTPLYATRGGA